MKTSFAQYVFTVILLFSLCITANADKQRNYVYVFDCTQSMDSDFHIWDKAKEWLKDDIMAKDDNVNITVVLFRDQADSSFSFCKYDFNWNEIENKANYLIGSPHNKTGICDAWDEGIKHLDNARENYFILLTDGADKHDGAECVKSRMRNWCSTHDGSYGFVVALSQTAKDALVTNLDDCKNMVVVGPIGTHIPKIGTFTNREFSMLSNSIRSFSTCFSETGTYKAHIKCNDPNYEVVLKDGQLSEGQAVFLVKEKQKPVNNCNVIFSIVSDDNNLWLCNPDFSIFVDTRELANIEFDQPNGKNGQYDMGTAETYEPFLFWKGKDVDTLSVKLGVKFNNRAKETNCKLNLKLDIPSELEGNVSILCKGQQVKGNVFTLLSTDTDDIITIAVHHSLAEGDYIIRFKGDSEKTECINAEEGNSYVSSIHLRHNIVCNPWILPVVIFTVVVLLLIISYFAKRRLNVIAMRKFTDGEQIALFSLTGRLTNRETGMKTTDLYGFVKLVVTQEQPPKQSKYSVLFKTGKIGYFVNNSIPQNNYFEVYPTKNQSICCKKGDHFVELNKKQEITIDKIDDSLSADFRIKYV